MKTNDLVTALAADLSPVDPARADRRFCVKLAAGGIAALAVVLFVMGTRADLAAAALLPMFWIKLLFPASLAVAAFIALRRLSYPGMRLGGVPGAAALLVAVVWLLAGAVVWTAPTGERWTLVLGQSWLECPLSIALLSLPAFVLAFRAARELAPTRLPLAGGAAGLFAGAVAAAAYALHCPETQAPFLAVWYVLGMMIPAGAGALLGRHLLRW